MTLNQNNQIERAKKVREMLEQKKREKDIFMLHRWKFYKKLAEDKKKKKEIYQKI